MSNFKLGELEQSIYVLANVLYAKDKNGQTVKFPFSLSYRLSKLLENMQKELTYFLSEKQKLAESFAQRDNNGKMITSTQKDGSYTIALLPDKINEFEASFRELCEVETELDCQPVSGLLDELLAKDIETDIESTMLLQRFFIKE